MSNTLKTIKLPYSTAIMCIETHNDFVVGKFVESDFDVEFYNEHKQNGVNMPMTMLHSFVQTLDVLLPLFYNELVSLVEIPFCNASLIVMHGANEKEEEVIGITVDDDVTTFVIGEYPMNADPKVILGMWKALLTQEALTA